MTDYLLILVVVIITLIALENILFCDELEHYDLEFRDIAEVDCGTRCTQALNCTGFAYKPVENTCYLSKTSIIGRPEEGLYSDKYTKLDRRCNKINRITDRNRVDGITLTKNSIYICSDGENNIATQFQYANLGASALEDVKTSVFTRADIDSTTPTEVSYDTMYIDWPKVKTVESPTYPTPLYNVPGTIRSDSGKSYGFVESDKEFLGQYMLAHQCVANVPFYDCLKYCENNSNCAGTEWNRTLIKKADDGDSNYLYEDVCCPKAVIKQIIPRRKEFDRGRFYVKKELQSMTDRDKIILTKTDNDSSTIPVNKQFKLELTNLDVNQYADIKKDTDYVPTPGLIEDIYSYFNNQ